LPVSAHECAASARIDADPVINAATDFAIATSRFAANATSTVVTLADAPSRDACDRGPRSFSESTTGLALQPGRRRAFSAPSVLPGQVLERRAMACTHAGHVVLLRRLVKTRLKSLATSRGVITIGASRPVVVSRFIVSSVAGVHTIAHRRRDG
jgi:hypothetical protein